MAESGQVKDNNIGIAPQTEAGLNVAEEGLQISGQPLTEGRTESTHGAQTRPRVSLDKADIATPGIDDMQGDELEEGQEDDVIY